MNGIKVGTYGSRAAAEAEAHKMLTEDWDGFIFTLRVEDDGRWTLVDETPAEAFL